MFKVSQIGLCGNQLLRWPPMVPASWYSHSCIVLPILYQSWSVWPRQYGKNNEVWVSMLHQKSHYCFSLLSSITHSGEARPCAVRAFEQPYGKAMWQGTESVNMGLWGMWVSHLGSGFSSSSQAFRWLQFLLTSWLPRHERSETTTTPLSCSRILDRER